MARRKNLLGADGRKVAPKLRMIANGSMAVNMVRAEQCSALAVTPQRVLRGAPQRRGLGAAPISRAEAPRAPKRGRLRALPRGVEVNVFVRTIGPRVDTPALLEDFPRRGDLVRATVRVDQLPRLTAQKDVAYVEIGEPLVPPTPTDVDDDVNAPPPALRRFGKERLHHFGAGVLVGIVDVGGFDFAHPDFLDDAGKTRFVRIWDQGGSARPSPATARYHYGAEFTQAHLDAAIQAAPGAGVPPHELERQSQVSVGSHGTHVASIAAGNRGICRRAPIAGVLVALPEADEDRRQSFYDSTRLADAVDYLFEIGRNLGLPVSINISLGTNGHAHDGTGAVGRWIDAALAIPGRSVCVAAGNAGQERGEAADDFGWIVGRIHTSGRVAARELVADVDWVVVGNGLLDISENELELWYSPQDRFAVSVRPPGGTWIGPVEPREFIENRQLPDGSFVSVYNELYHPANGANYIAVYLSPFLSPDAVVGVSAGTWTVRLHGREVRDGRFHGWIERDDPRPIGRVGPKEAWVFPSFFAEGSFVDDSTVSSLGCAQAVITVANLDKVRDRINQTSSQGPTRDGRPKPEVAAPGTDIVAAKGFAGGADRWVAMSGTSMASPFVTGVAGLMLATEPRLTGAQIRGIMLRTAKPMPGASFDWKNDAGFGELDAEACLVEAAQANRREDRTE
jgi:subtilisin family serine protease